MSRPSTLPASSIFLRRAPWAVLALLLFALNTWGIYALFTSRVQVAVWDFHPCWVGLRAMFLDGADPYSDEVTLAIQQQMLGRPARPDEDQQAFAYPLHSMALLGPLALLPLPIAQAAWFSLLEAGLLAFVVLAPRAVGWRPPTWLLAMTAVAAALLAWAVIRWYRAPQPRAAACDWALGMLVVTGALALLYWSPRPVPGGDGKSVQAGSP